MESRIQEYRIRIEGSTPILMHSTRGMVSHPFEEEVKEINKKRGTNKTSVDRDRLAWIECWLSVWIDRERRATIPPQALRSCVETAARKLKEGPKVRECFIVLSSDFQYDEERYGSTLDDIANNAQFQADVKVGQNRVLRTRALFEEWSCEFVVEVDGSEITEAHLEHWLDIAGRRIGLGDWRPHKGGQMGRFSVTDIELIEEAERLAA